MKSLSSSAGLIVAVLCQHSYAQAPDSINPCTGEPVKAFHGVPNVWKMDHGLAAYGPMNINIDGYARAYHRKNYQTDAVIHLCNAGKVYLPDGRSYHGSTLVPGPDPKNPKKMVSMCGPFMQEVARIEAAGWTDPKVGAVSWYGILSEKGATIRGRKVEGVVPILQSDGSGYYVSQTKLADETVPDLRMQDRYVHPLKVAAAVVPGALNEKGVVRVGSFGVAISTKKNIAVPFVVGDTGPAIGEGTPVLARRVAGLPLSDTITRANRYDGQVEAPDVLWVFFGDKPQAYKHDDPEATNKAAAAAFERWGGMQRLAACQSRIPRP